VTVVERQVHGYRKGHQLLAGSVRLPKEDQAAIDRLSDVAGPLRPRESFDPYLTGYPLPSGTHYVLARTWQDLTVTRAGCVRTISLIIPMADWTATDGISAFLALLELDRPPEDGDATSVSLENPSDEALPPVPDFQGSELLEALFLEDSQPVVLFDAPMPELIAVRLMTALWPSMRRRFAVSTFALSPRKVAGRDFNLVFAPKDARAKFSDWSGRRIDGRLSQSARHRWTGSIVGRVFDDPHPRLLTSKEVGLVGGDGEDVDSAAALRIALLWDELLGKLSGTPTAALGLLDIANSGKVRDAFAVRMLESSLADAVLRAPSILPEDEAWTFLGAIARKMHGRSMPHGVTAVGTAVGQLAGRAPEGAIALLSQPDDRGVITGLSPIIADGIGRAFGDHAERALLSARPEVFGRLLSESARLAEGVANDPLLVERVGEIIPDLEPTLAAAVGDELLPLLVWDWQLPAAGPLLKRLDEGELAAEIRHLGSVNDFEAPGLADLCIRRAREIGVKGAVLIALSEMPATDRRNSLLAQALDPALGDARWLLREAHLPDDLRATLFAGLLRRADDRQLGAMLGDPGIGVDAVSIAERAAPDLLQRMIFIDAVPLDVFVRIVTTVFTRTKGDDRSSIARRALQRCLGAHFPGDETAFLVAMLGGLGERLDGAWVARVGLASGIRPSLAGRNMVAFRKAPQPARVRVVSAMGEVGQILRDRRAFDLDAAAAEACANLLFEAEKAAPRAALAAAGHLLPMLMGQRKDPVSMLIAAAFPLIYRELAKKDDVPDLLKFIPFFDWDRCKAARQELVSAFLSSSWAPGDLALTACRCNDLGKILRRTAKSYGGDNYIVRVEADLSRLPDGCRKPAAQIISSIRSDWSSKFDWRD
jgi:GTPase-associated protein 1, N-terminal domain type 1